MIKTSNDVTILTEYQAEYVKTDSDTLNELLDGGLKTDNLIVLQAPTGVGKSTVMMRLAIRALIAHKKVMYYSCGEQSVEELKTKIICMLAAVPFRGYGKLDYSEDEYNKITDAFEKYKEMFDNLYFGYCDNGVCIDDFSEAIKNGVSYIFIDYIGSCLADTLDSQYAFMTRMASDLYHYAVNKHVCIFTAMQTNRALKAELRNPQCDLDSIDETFMADSIGPARKASICLSLVEYQGQKYLTVFKNRGNGKLGHICIEFRENTYQWVEMFNPKAGF